MIGEQIRKIRRERNISGAKAAELIGISPQYYYNIEKGRRNLSAENAADLSRIFDVSIDDLLKGNESTDVSHWQARALQAEAEVKRLQSILNRIKGLALEVQNDLLLLRNQSSFNN